MLLEPEQGDGVKARKSKSVIAFGAICLLMTLAGIASAGDGVPDTSGSASAQPSSAGAEGIPPGTVITMDNWRNYRQFMSDGMMALFEGKYLLKMPNDVQIEVGPTVIDPIAKNYLAATEKYAGQVKIVELPSGGLTLQGYRGGIPFPNPQEPHKGWKTLVNLWYRYMPHLLVDTHGSGCSLDSSGNMNCETYEVVDRQLSFNTDNGVSTDAPAADAKYVTEWFMVLEPEQSKYSASLTIDYADLSRPEEVYAFLPALRRYQPMSAAGRCAESEGMDWTLEDFRSGFDSNLTEVQASSLGRKKILALVGIEAPEAPFPEGFYMPLAWPKPSWSKWQVRDVDVVSVKKLPSKAAGYCYGNRIIYADAHFSSPLWEDLYDSKMGLWKFSATFPQHVAVPGVGPVNTPGVDVELIWDIQRNHASFGEESAKSVYVNEQAPAEFQDLVRYTTPGGLNLIMR
jgi:uncharacterized protein DUF1329